jgi:glucosyl-dolichyl phosphate glucuronosyltransferase
MMLSVIICTYNRERFLAESLISVANQHYPDDSYELILINNASTDSTAQIAIDFAKNYPQVPFHCFMETNQGLSHARNRGIAEAQGDVLVFIDDDIRLNPGYLSEISKFYKDNLSAMSTGNTIIPDYINKEPEWMCVYLAPLVGYHAWSKTVVQYSGKRFPVGASMAFRKEVFQKIGGFNTELGRKGKVLAGNEEKDMFFRMRSAGMNCWFLPHVVLYHIIDDLRLTEEYVRKQATGVGLSERIRIRNSGAGEWLLKITSEVFKSLATIVLSVGYALKGQFPKSRMLLKFRFWVWKGLAGFGNA